MLKFTLNNEENLGGSELKIWDETLKKFMKAKNNCILTPYVDKLIKLFGEYSPLIICDPVTKMIMLNYI